MTDPCPTCGRHPRSLTERIVAALVLSSVPMDAADLAEALDAPVGSVRTILWRLERAHRVRKALHGFTAERVA